MQRDESLAWITWTDIRDLVLSQAALLGDLPQGLGPTVQRLATSVIQAVEWHT